MKNVWTESCRLRLHPAELHLEPESAQGQAASSDGRVSIQQTKQSLITRQTFIDNKTMTLSCTRNKGGARWLAMSMCAF